MALQYCRGCILMGEVSWFAKADADSGAKVWRGCIAEELFGIVMRLHGCGSIMA